jgi:hypothetical protein
MASRLSLKIAPGFDHIWNVNGRVGGRSDCPNHPTDVELVKVLIKQALRAPLLAGPAAKVPTPVITVNGVFDAVVGYWIFRFQDHDGHPDIDGVVSPSKGISYSSAPGALWVIDLINKLARDADKDFWENLPNSPSISGALRHELQFSKR